MTRSRYSDKTDTNQVAPWWTAWLCAILLCVTQSAQALTQDDLKPLAGDDFDARVKAIETLGKQGGDDLAQAQAILQALHDDALMFSPSVGLVRQKEGGWVDALSGQRIAGGEGNLQGLSLNNRLRAQIESTLAGLQLCAPQAELRAQAIDGLLKNPESASSDLLQQVDAALAAEQDQALKSKLIVLWAMLALQEGSRPEKLKALDIIAANGGPQAEALLVPLISEHDAELQQAARNAQKAIQQRQFNGELLAHLFTGLSLGSVLLLAALGLAITYGLIGVINMAHGEFLMIGAYATYVVQSLFRENLPVAFDWYLLAALPASFLAAALVGLAIERLVLRHLYGRPLETLLATFGVSLLLMQGVRSLFGAQNVEVANPSWMSGALNPLPGLVLPYNRIVILVFALTVVAAAWAVLNKTRLGLFVRAVTQNRTMAACVGVRTWQVDSYAFAFGAGIAGLGGCALSQIGNVGPDLGQTYIIDSFMAVVLGGVGQLAGTVVGAFGLGILNKFIEPFAGAVLAKIMVLVLIVLFIQKRPQGLFALKGRSAEA